MRWWEMIVQRFRAPALMERMFARFDIRTRLVDRHHAAEMLRGAALRCMACGEAKACGEWLDKAETEGADLPPAYCRNAYLIRRLKRETETLH